ncbi:MAG: AAA family ATPase [Parcubacteria group bacterium]|nr:AAA family ATPase [Parcubacteria group bacterium]
MTSEFARIPESVPLAALVEKGTLQSGAVKSMMVFPFSEMTLTFNLSPDDMRRLVAIGYLILAPLNSNGKLFSVGVLGGIEHRYKDGVSKDLIFRGKCRVNYAVNKEQGDPAFNYARWVPMADVPVEDTVARTAPFRKKIPMLKNLFSVFLDEYLGDFDIGAKKNFFTLPYVADAINAVKELIPEDAQSLGRTLDGIMNVVYALSGSLNECLVLLRERSVAKRLDWTIELLALLNGMNRVKRSEKEKNMPGNPHEERYRKIRDKLPEDTRKEIERELRNISRLEPGGAEWQKIDAWLQLVFDLPWGIYDEAEFQPQEVRAVLDEDHWGLEKVKERTLRYIASHQRNPRKKSPKLAFIGPPGVGKTSLGKSIARALGRKFVRISVGGVRDEAEIRGHRRTYIGALPGRIVDGLRKAGSMNPVFMIDEVDKLEHGIGISGDPEAAMLEVLDPEQNHAFEDRYLSFSLDLSQVIFICTGNLESRILPALRDRLEIIRLPGYTAREKLNILRSHILPRRLEENKMKEEDLSVDALPSVTITDDALLRIVDSQKEAGVRGCEKALDQLLESILLSISPSADKGRRESLRISVENIKEFLPEIREKPDDSDILNLMAGSAVGLAVTELGGQVMVVEASRRRHTQWEIHITGHLDKIAPEAQSIEHSAKVALDRLIHEGGILEHGAENSYWIGIYLGDGAVPKSGPSAGIAFYVALYSLLTNQPVKNGLAMTGEITKRRMKVKQVGGIRDKILAAINVGLTEVMIPADNASDLVDINEADRQGITVHLIHTPEEALAIAFPEDQRITDYIANQTNINRNR